MIYAFEIYDLRGRIIATANNAQEALQKYNAGSNLFSSQRILEVGKKEIGFIELSRLANLSL